MRESRDQAAYQTSAVFHGQSAALQFGYRFVRRFVRGRRLERALSAGALFFRPLILIDPPDTPGILHHRDKLAGAATAQTSSSPVRRHGRLPARAHLRGYSPRALFGSLRAFGCEPFRWRAWGRSLFPVWSRPVSRTRSFEILLVPA